MRRGGTAPTTTAGRRPYHGERRPRSRPGRELQPAKTPFTVPFCGVPTSAVRTAPDSLVSRSGRQHPNALCVRWPGWGPGGPIPRIGHDAQFDAPTPTSRSTVKPLRRAPGIEAPPSLADVWKRAATDENAPPPCPARGRDTAAVSRCQRPKLGFPATILSRPSTKTAFWPRSTRWRVNGVERRPRTRPQARAPDAGRALNPERGALKEPTRRPPGASRESWSGVARADAPKASRGKRRSLEASLAS